MISGVRASMGITMEELESCIGMAQRTRGMRERIERIKAMAELGGIKSENISGSGAAGRRNR